MTLSYPTATPSDPLSSTHPHNPIFSERYRLTLAEAKQGFALATFAKNKFSRFITPLISLAIIAWGISLGMQGVGRYYMFLGITFLILQLVMRLMVLPALFTRQYKNYGYGEITQGLDLFQDYGEIVAADRRQRFDYHDVKRCSKGKQVYLLELNDRTVVIVPLYIVTESGQQAWFESVFKVSR